MPYYTGVGSRKTPPDVLILMSKISKILSKLGYTLRSGGAKGADQAFESEASLKEIYLPWLGFENNTSNKTYTQDALILADKYHPRFNKLTDGTKKMMARNRHQVLGWDLKTPSEFIICWTREAKDIGGTSQAIRIAKDNKILIYNLADPNQTKQLIKLLSILYLKRIKEKNNECNVCR